MNIKQIKKILTDGGIEENEAKIEAKMLVKHFLGLTDIDLALNDEFEGREILLQKAEFRAKTRTPIQQIIGKAYFMGEDFIVNENVLIPRDETEILVRKAIELIKFNNFKKVLDIGMGSGCISCMIAKNSEAKVIGIDISEKALEVAKQNAVNLGLSDKISFKKSDIFSNLDEKFDIIISNPPYIPISMKHELQKELSFEPEVALFAQDEKGIEFYEKIIMNSFNFLNENGILIFELGEGQADAVKKSMIENNFKNIEIIEDLAYVKRVILGMKG